jgi:hypothetical protein
MNKSQFFRGRVVALVALLAVAVLVAAFYGCSSYMYEQKQAGTKEPVQEAPQATPERVSVVGYFECLPHKDTTGPQTAECAFGIAIDQSDGHYGINTSLMSTYPVDFKAGTKVRVTGTVMPPEPASKYDTDGTIWATTIEKL